MSPILNLILLSLACFLAACSAKEPQRPISTEQPPSPDRLYVDQADGGRVGNGGGIVRCQNSNSIGFTQLYDFYEASKEIPDWKINIDFKPDPSKSNFEQAIDTALHIINERWKPVDPVLGDFFTEKLKQFPQEVNFVATPLKILSDGDGRFDLDQGCRYLQIANQLNDSLYPWEKRYLLQVDLFESPELSHVDRAGLLIHEIIYRMTILGGAKNSRSARIITALLFSDQFRNHTQNQFAYFNLLKTSSFPFFGANGVALKIDDNLTFFSGKVVAGFALVGSRARTVIGDDQDVACHIKFDQNGVATHFSSVRGGPITIGPKYDESNYYHFTGTALDFSPEDHGIDGLEDSFKSLQPCANRSSLQYDIAGSLFLSEISINSGLVPAPQIDIENNFFTFKAPMYADVRLVSDQFIPNELHALSQEGVLFKFEENMPACKASYADIILGNLTLIFRDSCVIRTDNFQLHANSVMASDDTLEISTDHHKFLSRVMLHLSDLGDRRPVLVQPRSLVRIDRNGLVRHVCVAQDITMTLASTHQDYSINTGQCVNLTELGEVEDDSPRSVLPPLDDTRF